MTKTELQEQLDAKMDEIVKAQGIILNLRHTGTQLETKNESLTKRNDKIRSVVELAIVIRYPREVYGEMPESDQTPESRFLIHLKSLLV